MGLTLHDILENILVEHVSDEDVLDAIHNRNYVKIKYDDGKPNASGKNPKGIRVIQPFALGTTKKGHPVVRAFQINGNSRKGAPKWKFFRLDRIQKWSKMNKTFNSAPDIGYGEYNTIGDDSMLNFYDNVKLPSFSDTLDKVRNDTEVLKNTPKISVKNSTGPINANQQWKKNVFTSQPNSKKYADYAKNVADTSEKGDDFWSQYDLAQKEAEQQNQQGPINSYDENYFDEDEVEFNENNFSQNKNRK